MLPRNLVLVLNLMTILIMLFPPWSPGCTARQIGSCANARFGAYVRTTPALNRVYVHEPIGHVVEPSHGSGGNIPTDGGERHHERDLISSQTEEDTTNSINRKAVRQREEYRRRRLSSIYGLI